MIRFAAIPLAVLGVLPAASLAQGVQPPAHPAPPAATQVAKVEAPEACVYCGMNRTRFSRSRMLVSYPDGSQVGTCSIHCTAIELKKTQGTAAKALLVGDRGDGAHKLIDARSAVWVIGGSERGVMTPVAKWAFARKEDAEAFIQKSGGKLAGFEEALAVATQELKK